MGIFVFSAKEELYGSFSTNKIFSLMKSLLTGKIPEPIDLPI